MNRILILILPGILSNFSSAAIVSGQGTWETTLKARDLDGNTSTIEAYYDTAQGMTWLADANYAATSGFEITGYMDWDEAMDWVGNLTLGGHTGWRLPEKVDIGNDGCPPPFNNPECGQSVDTTSDELAFLFHEILGNLSYTDENGNTNEPGWGLTNSGPFLNIQANWQTGDVYWYGIEYATNSNNAWYFDFYAGETYDAPKQEIFVYPWAVHDGDIGAAIIPLPASAWIFLSAAGVLIGFKRKTT